MVGILERDYHLPIDHDVNIFVSAFEFENPEQVQATYKETGNNKYGLDAKVGNFAIRSWISWMITKKMMLILEM